MAEVLYVYACSSIVLLGIQGGVIASLSRLPLELLWLRAGKYFYWYRNETSAGGFEMRGPQIDK